MTLKAARHKTISVVIGSLGAAERDYLSGIFRFVNAHASWSLEFHRHLDELAQRRTVHGEPDGILVVAPHAIRQRTCPPQNIPTVVIDIPDARWRPGEAVSFVRLDDRRIGHFAAEHLLSRGSFNAFLCVIDQPQFAYPGHRDDGFRARLAGLGKPVRTLVISESVLDANETAAIRRVLTGLPHPLAVFAVRDRAAFKILDICRRARIAIPDEAAVLSVDNDELFCNSLKPSLSSLLPDHEQVGILAARELERLMRRGGGREVVLAESVKRIVLRESTRIIPPAARILTQALDYIDGHATGNLRVPEVADHVGVSRRLLDLRFRQLHGTTVLDAIVRARLARMQRKLRDASVRIASVAADCGFSSPAAFTRFFTAHVGVSPAAWRRQAGVTA
ncbi:MAG: substrate-binding domain-containing protein [Kiritimatiellia bacterium]